MLKSTAQAARASQWIENKLKRSITKNMMYPACSDMRLPGLIPFDSPHVDRPLSKGVPDAGAPPLRPSLLLCAPTEQRANGRITRVFPQSFS